MKKRILAGVLCLLLALPLAAPPARADGYLCFVAAGDVILPLSDRTMPVWYNGYLYISSEVFTGDGLSALRIGRAFGDGGSRVVLYSGGQSLWYDRGSDHGYDTDGRFYYPGCLVRNGEFFVPAAAVAKFFGMLYSVTDIDVQMDGETVRGGLAWLRYPGSVMTDKEFYAAAAFPLASRYEEYMRGKGDQSAGTPAPVPDGVEIEGRRVYLCLRADRNTPAMLDVLDSSGAQAAFFCAPGFLAEEGDLLRRMAATGQAVGILADAADPDRTVAEQLEAGNLALEQATCGRTRLALIQNGAEAERRVAREAGFRCLEPGLSGSLTASAHASALLQRISASRGNVTVWLEDRVSAAGLRAFLAAAEDAEGRCLAWTETA